MEFENQSEAMKVIILEKEKIQKENEKFKKEIIELHQKIEKLIEQKGNTTIINIDKQINLNNYGNEDLSHITNCFKDNLLKVQQAIPKMIEEVHFSDKKPENKNILLPNKKDNLIKVYQENKWIYKDKKTTITNLMENNYNIIDEHFEENEDVPKHIENQYNNFRQLYKSNDKTLQNDIKVDCELVLLNNRN